MEKVTKTSFLKHATEHGLCLLGVTSKPLNELEKILDEAPVMGPERDVCTVKGNHLTRITVEGRESHLHLTKDETVYKHKDFFCIHTVIEPDSGYQGRVSTIIYK